MPARRLTVSRRGFLALVFLPIIVVVFVVDHGQIHGDGLQRWNTLHELMENHTLTADKYSAVQPLLAIPVYMAGDAWYRITAASENNDATSPEAARIGVIRSFVKRYNKLVAILIIAWFYTVLQSWYGLGPHGAASGSFFLVFGSILIPHAKDFYSECTWTLLLLLVLSVWVRMRGAGPRETWLNGIALVVLLALLVPLNPLMVMVLSPLFILGIICDLPEKRHGTGWARFLWLAGGIGAGCAVCFAENLVRRGATLDFGYHGEGFSTPLLHGLWGQLASPTRGIVFFMPGLFCAALFLRRDYRAKLTVQGRRFIAVTLATSAALVVAYAKWHSWHGAWYWGPRFLLPLSVLAALYFVVAVATGRRLLAGWAQGLLLLIGTTSFLVRKVGMTINQKYLLECYGSRPDTETCYWSFEYLPFASLLNRHDLHTIATHHSTTLEFGALLILLALMLFVVVE